jgi:RHS repeat-associated protein
VSGDVVGFDSDPSSAIAYDDQHLAKTLGLGRMLFYDASGRVIADTTGDAITEYIWSNSELIAIVSTVPPAGPVVHSVATDHLGAPWRAWDSTTGDLSWSVSYDPFGQVAPSDGATTYSPTPAIAERRPGQIADPESGLYQNGWRVYDASMGRYTQPDKLSYERSDWSEPVYAYASDNPLEYSDPDGLRCKISYTAKPLENVMYDCLVSDGDDAYSCTCIDDHHGIRRYAIWSDDGQCPKCQFQEGAPVAGGAFDQTYGEVSGGTTYINCYPMGGEVASR